MASKDFLRAVPPFDGESGDVNVVIETPRGSRQKYTYDPELGLFRWKFELPEGNAFPYSFGFVPNTLGEDGDPVDILLLLDANVPVGTLVPAKLIGVIEAEQTKEGNTVRNDRLLAVAPVSRSFRGTEDIEDLRPGLVEELEQFFVRFNAMRGQRFEPVGRRGPERARELLEEAIAKAGKGGE